MRVKTTTVSTLGQVWSNFIELTEHNPPPSRISCLKPWEVSISRACQEVIWGCCRGDCMDGKCGRQTYLRSKPVLPGVKNSHRSFYRRWKGQWSFFAVLSLAIQFLKSSKKW